MLLFTKARGPGYAGRFTKGRQGSHVTWMLPFFCGCEWALRYVDTDETIRSVNLYHKETEGGSLTPKFALAHRTIAKRSQATRQRRPHLISN